MASMFFNKGGGAFSTWGAGGESWCLPAGQGPRVGGSTSPGDGAQEREEQILGLRSHLAGRPEALQGVLLVPSLFSVSGIKKQLVVKDPPANARDMGSMPGGCWIASDPKTDAGPLTVSMYLHRLTRCPSRL